MLTPAKGSNSPPNLQAFIRTCALFYGADTWNNFKTKALEQAMQNTRYAKFWLFWVILCGCPYFWFIRIKLRLMITGETEENSKLIITFIYFYWATFKVDSQFVGKLHICTEAAFWVWIDCSIELQCMERYSSRLSSDVCAAARLSSDVCAAARLSSDVCAAARLSSSFIYIFFCLLLIIGELAVFYPLMCDDMVSAWPQFWIKQNYR